MLYQFLLFSKVNQLFFRCCCSVTKLCPTLCNQWIAARQSSLCPTISQSWKAIHICICTPLFWISFPFRSPQSIDQSSLINTLLIRVLFTRLSFVIYFIHSLIFYLPQSISGRILSENSVNSYFFREHALTDIYKFVTLQGIWKTPPPNLPQTRFPTWLPFLSPTASLL